MSEPTLSIIIPAYKESDRIGDSLDTLAEFLASRDYPEVEVIVVSQDHDTHEAAAKAAKKHSGFRSIELLERAGKGGAVRIGIYEATGRYKMFMDADLATPLHHLDAVDDFIKASGEVAIAVRHIETTHTGVRKFISGFGNLLVRILLTPGIKDTQCGFKVFESGVAHQLFGRQKITGWAFDMELLALARKFKYKIDIIIADDWHDPKAEGLVGDSNAKAAIESGVDMLKIKWRLMTGQYKRISYHHKKLSTD